MERQGEPVAKRGKRMEGKNETPKRRRNKIQGKEGEENKNV